MKQDKKTAEETLRDEIDRCRGCDVCRTLLDGSCHVFPELFRLLDKEAESRGKIGTDDLRHLVELCNFCGQCPCFSLKAAVLNAKTEFKARYGLGLRIKAIEDVERVGKLGSAIPRLSNFLSQNKVARELLEKTVGIHKDRKIPSFPKESFSEWIERPGNNIKARTKEKRVAYFAGCTAKYFFPEVAKSVVEVFEKNGIGIHYVEHRCCGMPSLLEGDRNPALESARINLADLVELVNEGYDIVCSCPTCSYMLRNVVKEGAYCSSEYMDFSVSDDGLMKFPLSDGCSQISVASIAAFKSIFKGLIKDEGYFCSISPKDRVSVAENTYDVGEYLWALHTGGELDRHLGPIPLNTAYYPPCHLREQNIGKPYQDLLSLIPGFSMNVIEGLYCCGNAGIMGFKREFHRLSIRIASRLITKIKALNPDVLATDCLSCRIQFNQLTPYKVMHPIELIKESYGNYQEQT
jgi:glycerol-3-phosphate dehydrogenase subunit C